MPATENIDPAASIGALLEELTALRAEKAAGFEASDPEGKVAAANYAKRVAERERDEAVAALAKVKADVQWTMGALQIRDIIFMCGKVIPAAEEGWLIGWGTDPEDTLRVEWINHFGRCALHESSWGFSLPHNLQFENDAIPQPYNFRHMIDLCRKTAPNGN